MNKRKWIYIIITIIILIGSFLYFFPEFFPSLYRNIKFKIVKPKNYQECVWAGGKETLGDVHMADGESCEINGKVFGPWSF